LVAPVTPTVMLLVDRSGTMTDPFGPEGEGTPSRWDALFDVLMNPVSGLVAELEEDVRFGLTAYTASDATNDGVVEGACPMIDVVPPARGNHSAIAELYGALAPLDETPTGEAVAAASAALGAVEAEGPKVLLLATDGEPDTCAMPNPNGSAQARTVALLAVMDAFDAGVRTFVVSVGGEAVGNPEAEAHMRELASAGVGLAPDAEPGAPLYVAFDPDQLVAALQAIIAGVRTCSFQLDGEVAPRYAQSGTVTLNGVELEYGVTWRLLDTTTLELMGEACDQILAGGEHEVHATFTCEAVVD
jgi:hypothetical protein